MVIDVLVFVIETKSNFQIILQNFDIRYFHYMTPYVKIEHIATENFDSNTQHVAENRAKCWDLDTFSHFQQYTVEECFHSR